MSEPKPQVTFKCDGCGKEGAGLYNGLMWRKPDDWYSRSDESGPQIACSRKCIHDIAKRTGKTDLVLPI